MMGVSQVGVGFVGHVSRQTHIFSCSRITVHVTVKIALDFGLCNYLIVIYCYDYFCIVLKHIWLPIHSLVALQLKSG